MHRFSALFILLTLSILLTIQRVSALPSPKAGCQTKTEEKHYPPHLADIISNLNQEHRALTANAMKLIDTGTWLSGRLCKYNHKLIKDRDSHVSKKIAMTAANTVLVPVTFVGDVLLGHLSKKAIKINHNTVYNQNVPAYKKALLVTGTAIAMPILVPADIIYHYGFNNLMVGYSFGMHLGAGSSDFKTSRKLITQLADYKEQLAAGNEELIQKTLSGFRFWRLRRAVKGLGVKLDKAQTMDLLSEALATDSPAFNDYLSFYEEQWAGRSSPGGIRDGITRFSPDVIKRVKAPAGIAGLAKLIVLAFNNKNALNTGREQPIKTCAQNEKV